MHIARPLILGAGPAGCAAAIELARAGERPILLDRSESVGDPLCGGFLSWRTMAQLEALGLDAGALGGHLVDHLRLFAHGRVAQVQLPSPALGLSRHQLDSALRRAALAAGADFEIDTIRSLAGNVAKGERREWSSNSLFLASGKHDIRGQSRPRGARDPALGLRLRLPAHAERTALTGSAIELHLFEGGYAGIVLQEGCSSNICLAVRKSALAAAGGQPVQLLESMAARNRHFAARLGEDWHTALIDTIGAVPYGWIARDTDPGLFRLGDQAAVIPSLAGEGMSIALASGAMAARYWLEGGAAAARPFQSAFAARAMAPVQTARAARFLAESRLGGAAALAVTRLAPTLVTKIAERSRMDAGPMIAGPATCT